MKRSARDSEESAALISRRGLMLAGLQFAAITTLGLRMRNLQVEKADQFRLLSDGNSIKLRLIPPARGLIQDRNGALLAGNEQTYRVTLTRADAGDVTKVLADLRRLIAMTDAEAEAILKEIAKRSPITPVAVADRLSWDEFTAVAVNAPALPGVTPEVGLSRRYTREGDFAHVLGYVGPVSDYDLSKLESPDPLLLIPRFQIGKVGLEAKLESNLRGAAGTRRVEVNSSGREMRELGRQDGIPGDTLKLTLDYRLQNFALARLKAESAAAVVMDVTSGDILAIASAPSFDPNLFVRGISSRDYQALTENDHRPLADKTVQGLYPPGSTFKMVTALAALEAGVLKPNETVQCRGHIEVSGRKFHCWKRSGHGRVGLIESLEQSCDVFYYDLAQRTGIDKISAMANRLGLGVKHDLPMSAVAEGLAPTRAWKLERHKKEWMIGDTINSSIGQGFVLASPLQLAVMTARLATGKEVVPRLVKARDGVEIPVAEAADLGLSAEAMRAVRAGMEAVVNSKKGTAQGSRVVAADARMAGKTGTSQVRNISTAERDTGVLSNEELPWRSRDHALFVCYAPIEAPKVAVAVIIEHGGGGSAVAAPVARDILLYALRGGLPPLADYPEAQRARIQSEFESLTLLDPEAPVPGVTRA